MDCRIFQPSHNEPQPNPNPNPNRHNSPIPILNNGSEPQRKPEPSPNSPPAQKKKQASFLAFARVGRSGFSPLHPPTASSRKQNVPQNPCKTSSSVPRNLNAPPPPRSSLPKPRETSPPLTLPPKKKGTATPCSNRRASEHGPVLARVRARVGPLLNLLAVAVLMHVSHSYQGQSGLRSHFYRKPEPQTASEICPWGSDSPNLRSLRLAAVGGSVGEGGHAASGHR